MKAKFTRPINLIAGGKDNWESTEEFRKKVNAIRRELADKYSIILSAEKNWFRREFIRFRLWLEIRKRISEASSWKNLHLTSW